jgi:transposase
MYSLDFRHKLFEVKKKENLTLVQAAQRFGVGLATVGRWSRNITPLTTRHKPAWKLDMEALKRDIETYPDAYQHERAARLGVSKAAIWYALKRLGVTYKKNSCAPQSPHRRTRCVLPKSS